MERQDQVDFGQRLFVMGVVFILVAELIFMCLALGEHFSWVRLFLGALGITIVLLAANAIYGGSRSAYGVALGWVGLALLLTALPLINDRFSNLGPSQTWASWLKLIAYGFFGLLLLVPVSVHSFIASRRGEEVMVREKMVLDPGSPLAWTTEQNQAFKGLTSSLIAAASILILVGLWLLTLALAAPTAGNVDPWALLEAVAFLALGVVALLPVSAWNAVASSESGKGYLMQALGQLTWVTVAAALACLAVGAVVVIRLLTLFTLKGNG
jgi:hypothetical protein